MARIKRLTHQIVDALVDLRAISAIVLYGSAARGELTSRSDLDLLILTTRDIKDTIEDRIISLESKINRPIQPTIRLLKELGSSDTGLLKNIFQEGKILFLRDHLELPVSTILQLKPFVVYSFNLVGLPHSAKSRINRELYGHIMNKYTYKGLLGSLEGSRLSAGCVMVSLEATKKLEAFFSKKQIQFSSMKVWR